MVYDKKICFVHETHIYFTEIKKNFCKELKLFFLCTASPQACDRIKSTQGAEPHHICHIGTVCERFLHFWQTPRSWVSLMRWLPGCSLTCSLALSGRSCRFPSAYGWSSPPPAWWSLIEFIDCRYSQSCWYLRPLLWTVAPPPSLWPPPPLPLPKVNVQYIQTVCGCGGGCWVVL